MFPLKEFWVRSFSELENSTALIGMAGWLVWLKNGRGVMSCGVLDRGRRCNGLYSSEKFSETGHARHAMTKRHPNVIFNGA